MDVVSIFRGCINFLCYAYFPTQYSELGHTDPSRFRGPSVTTIGDGKKYTITRHTDCRNRGQLGARESAGRPITNPRPPEPKDADQFKLKITLSRQSQNTELQKGESKDLL